MVIGGLQKMTLLDFPGRVACTVFLEGCNYRCPYCHNSGLLTGGGEPLMTAEALLDFLRKRRGMLDAVCVSGGEPTLHPDLPDLLREIKALGYQVKLDTNGSRPEVLRRLAEDGLVDYVAMDVKNSPARYAQTTGCPGVRLEDVESSLRFLLGGGVDFELRTTVVRELHDEASIQDMGAWVQSLGGPNAVIRFFIQPYTDRDSVLCKGLNRPEDEELGRFQAALAPYAQQVEIRG